MFQRIIILILLYIATALPELKAQHSINASGGEISGTGGSTSYSIGQVFNQTYKSTSGSAATGIQQPYEIFVINNIENHLNITLNCSVFPNPTSDAIVLDFKDFDETMDWMYTLFNTNGAALEKQLIINSSTSINLSNLPPSVYFLKLTSNNIEIRTFKIIKN